MSVPSNLVLAVTMCFAAGVGVADEPDAQTAIERMLAAVGGRERIEALDNLAVRADCTGPGGEFTTEVVSMTGGRTWFRQLSDRGAMELLRDGRTGWHRNAETGERTPLDEGQLFFVAGHEFHLLVLEVDRRFTSHELRGPDEVDGRACTRVAMKDPHGQPASICVDDETGLPLELVQQPPAEFGPDAIRIRFGDWETIGGIRYFRSFVLDHGDSRFTYDYTSIEPGGGHPALFEPDAAELLRLHEQVLQAHLEGDLEAWLDDESEDYVLANRGEITRPTRQERAEQIGPYLDSTRFSEYRDLVPPVVRVSDDGSLGWVIAQVRVAGEQTAADGTTRSFETVWAWIELYENRDGRWLRVGNVSNRRPS